jgi:predicted negative regulator of RcsB-dependent stress response
MATYDLEEQEQIEELKTWWKMHGNLITAVVVAVAVAVAGWLGWNRWQSNQAAQASVLYGGVQVAAMQQNAKRARELAGELIDKYSGTSYAGLAALLSAKVQADGGDAKSAQSQLAWAVDNAKDDSVRDLARLRLGAMLLDDKAYDEAIKRLSVDPIPSLLPRFNELRGDVLAAQGKSAEARTAYETALTKVDAMVKEGGGDVRVQTAYRDMLQVKLDTIGGGK